MDNPSPVPRRIGRPRWLDVRLVAGVLLVVAAVLIGATVLSHARHTEKELAVTRDLAAGAQLRADDVQLVDVQLPTDSRVYVDDPTKAIGHTLARPLAQGQLLAAADLGRTPDRTTVTVPFAADAAPRLVRGQRIVIWLSTAKCPSTVLLPDVTVQDVRTADSGSFSTDGEGQSVVLTVPAALAQRVIEALAIEDAVIRAGILSGAAAPRPTLPDVAACTAS